MSRIEQGIEALQKGRLEEGIQLLEEVRKEFPNEPDMLYNLGMAYSDLGLIEKAIATLNECVEERGEANDLTALGVAYFRHKELEKAKDAFEKALRLEPNNFGFVA